MFDKHNNVLSNSKNTRSLKFTGSPHQLSERDANGKKKKTMKGGHFINDDDDNLALRASNYKTGKWNGIFLDIMEQINNHNTALMEII
jgi:hypothetical protein